MNRSDRDNALDRREFLRSATLLGAGAGVSVLAGACSDDSPTRAGRKWIRLDATDVTSGVLMSLDGFSDMSEGPLTSDVEMIGHIVLPSGDILPLTTRIDKDFGNSLSMESLGGDAYRLEAAGIPQPLAGAFEIHLVERTIPGTNVIILTGYSVNPVTARRVNFTITHDPWRLVVVVAVGVVIYLVKLYTSDDVNLGYSPR